MTGLRLCERVCEVHDNCYILVYTYFMSVKIFVLDMGSSVAQSAVQ